MWLLKMMCFILLRHVLCPDLVFSPRNVRACGCPRMIFRTHPHGHHPRFCSSRLCSVSVTGSCRTSWWTPTSPRTVSLIRRSLITSSVHSSTAFMSHPLCGGGRLQRCCYCHPDTQVQNRVTLDILNHGQPFTTLKQSFVVSIVLKSLRLCA